MAKKRQNLFLNIKHIFKFKQLNKGLIVHCCLMLLTVFLSITASVFLAKAPATDFANQNLILKQKNNLVKPQTHTSISSLWTGEKLVAEVQNFNYAEMSSSSAEKQDLVQQGKTLYEAGQYAQAVRILQQAVASLKANGENLKTAIALSNLSLVNQQLGLWAEAEKAIAQSINLLENLDNSPERSAIQAQALDVKGKLQFGQGKTEAALKTWQQAAYIHQQIDNRPALIRNQINSAQALQALGLYRQANKILVEVEQSLKNQPDTNFLATGLLSLGNVLQVVGDFKESQRVLQQSLVEAKASSSNQIVSEILFSLGNITRTQQDNKAALAYYQQAQAASTDPTRRIQAQLNQLSLLVQTKMFPDALTISSKIKSEINKLPLSRMAIYAKINFAQSLMKLAKSKEKNNLSDSQLSDFSATATQVLVTAIQQSQTLQDNRAESYALGTLGELYEQRNQLVDAQKFTEKALFIAQSINASDIAYQWQWQSGRLLKQQRNIKEAIANYSEAVKSLQFLRSDLVATNPDIQFSFRESVEPVYREFVELLLQSPINSPPSQENLKQARFVIESLQLAELDNFFRAACFNAKQIVDTLVDKTDQQAAIIYPIILPDRLDVILKLPNQELRHYRSLVTQDQVANTVTQLRQSLINVSLTSQAQENSQKIYDWLIKPEAAELTKSGIKTLVFVLDGDLRNVPMAALYDQEQKQYLIEKYAIALTPSLQLLDPKPLQKVRLNALIAGVGEARSIENRKFSPLENVPREMKEIQSEIPKSKELLNQNFTQINLQNELLKTAFSVVHLATHGEFSSDPEKTFILTWDKLLKVKEFENLLRRSDQSLSSSIELLVLSACKTAQGDKRAALGLAGVAVQAGARSTLATLWSVDDESTTNLMSEFYRQLNTGLNKAEALQRAQLAVFAQQKYPYYWAPFVLVGNWL